MMHKFGDVILTKISFTDKNITKKRPAPVLFEEFDNYIVAGITSNVNMQGISLTKKEGVIKSSVIKTNYIFTIGKDAIIRRLFSLTTEKKGMVCNELRKKICGDFKS